MIAFNKPPYVGKEIHFIEKAIEYQKLSGDGYFTKQCNEWIEKRFQIQKCLLTTSATHALEMAALICDIKQGDEIIVPSYTFISSASAFVLRGAKLVYIDICPDTMNIDERLVERAITEKTKVIVVVHYAGVSCNMEKISAVAKKYGVIVVEDAAQGVLAKYKDKYLGSIGDIGVYSFHDTKNYTMGEGGAILINNPSYHERAEIIREKGTNRSKFLRGQVDKYTWVDLGSSYLPSELNAAYLYAQLEYADKINDDRMDSWNRYHKLLSSLEKKGILNLPYIPEYATHNAHMYYIKTKDIEERTRLIQYLKEKGISAAFHYVPLHSSVAGKKYGHFFQEDLYTTKESSRLLRLPMFYGITSEEIEQVCCSIKEFYGLAL